MKKFDLNKFYHFHHLFLGLLIAIVFYANPLLFNLGLGISLADVVHHFVVLLFILKTPEFHIVYKNVKAYKTEGIKDSKKIKRFLKHIVHEVEDI